jgi:hypothetical protein
MQNEERKFLHDLATPLGGLYLLLKTLIEDAEEEGKKELATKLERCLGLSKKMGDLLNDRRTKLESHKPG